MIPMNILAFRKSGTRISIFLESMNQSRVAKSGKKFSPTCPAVDKGKMARKPINANKCCKYVFENFDIYPCIFLSFLHNTSQCQTAHKTKKYAK